MASLADMQKVMKAGISAKLAIAEKANVSNSLSESIAYGASTGIVAPVISGAKDPFSDLELLPEVVVTATKKVATENKILVYVLGGCLIIFLLKKFVL